MSEGPDAPDDVNYSMIVAFCDLKGSTKALRCLGGEFTRLQTRFFTECSNSVRSVNWVPFGPMKPENPFLGGFKEEDFPAPWARVDKFMGDCTMFYVKCAPSKSISTAKAFIENECLQNAAKKVLTIIDLIVRAVDDIASSFPKLQDEGILLGSRVGLAAGRVVTLGPLTVGDDLPGQSYTVTGETVNLAARLEHATPAEFLSCVSDVRSELEIYGRGVIERKHLHGTDVGNELNRADRQVVDIYEVCKCRFQVRANDLFVKLLSKGKDPNRLRWREIPFSPQGFEGRQTAHLLGGNTSSDLFRPV